MTQRDLETLDCAPPQVRDTPAGEPLPARLCIVYPPKLRRQIPLPPRAVRVGREVDMGGIAIEHPTVSRAHLDLDYDARERCHTAADRASRNGLFIDGERARPYTRVLLGDGTMLRLGHVLLVYERGVDVDSDRVSRQAIPGVALSTGALRAALARVARDPAPVLLLGETGVGKERVAQEIHRLSGRTGRFVAVNCAAFSPQLVESELFGHERGAFTGSDSSRKGVFRHADGGTLLLDEIGDLPLEQQAKLLRALSEGEIQTVGGARPVHVDVRVVAATHHDLGAAAEAGMFRRDLYARLALWQLRVPPLRERRADLIEWLERLHSLWAAQRPEGDRPALDLDIKTAEALLLSPWRDNLRGLARMVHDLACEPPARLAIERGPASWYSEPKPLDARAAGARRRPVPSREDVTAAFERLGRSVRATARFFERDRRQIYRWIAQYGLDSHEKPGQAPPSPSDETAPSSSRSEPR